MDLSNNNIISQSFIRLLLSGPSAVSNYYQDPFSSVGRTSSDVDYDMSNVTDISSVTQNNLDNEYMEFFRSYLFSNILSTPPSYNRNGSNRLQSIMQRSFLDPSQNLYKKVLSKEGVNQIKNVIYEKNKFPNDSCPVTLHDFKEGEEVSQLPCGHIFQPDAVLKWLKDEKASCPVCRKPLASKEVKKTFKHPNRRGNNINRRLNSREILRNFIDNQIQREEEAEIQAAIIASLRDLNN